MIENGISGSVKLVVRFLVFLVEKQAVMAKKGTEVSV